jgi:hypothetical protein
MSLIHTVRAHAPFTLPQKALCSTRGRLPALSPIGLAAGRPLSSNIHRSGPRGLERVGPVDVRVGLLEAPAAVVLRGLLGDQKKPPTQKCSRSKTAF